MRGVGDDDYLYLLMPVRVPYDGGDRRASARTRRLPQLRDGIVRTSLRHHGGHRRNGQGKTNLAEALAYLATLDSFRAAPTDALIRVGADTAVMRATVRHDDGREMLIEVELAAVAVATECWSTDSSSAGRVISSVSSRVTVFSPDDLAW